MISEAYNEANFLFIYFSNHVKSSFLVASNPKILTRLKKVRSTPRSFGTINFTFFSSFPLSFDFRNTQLLYKIYFPLYASVSWSRINYFLLLEFCLYCYNDWRCSPFIIIYRERLLINPLALLEKVRLLMKI